MTEKKAYEVDIIYRNMNDATMDHIHTYTLGDQMEEDGMFWEIKEIKVCTEREDTKWTVPLRPTDYLYCEDCRTVVDFWKYDHDLEAAGHAGHNVRSLTDEEFREAIFECEEAGCFE